MLTIEFLLIKSARRFNIEMILNGKNVHRVINIISSYQQANNIKCNVHIRYIYQTSITDIYSTVALMVYFHSV